METSRMKQRISQLATAFFSLILLSHVQWVAADTAIDTEKLLNWAENTYPQFFPSRQATQNIEPWLFRHYPESGVYAGVNKGDSNVYVMGGPWGNSPTIIDTLPRLVSVIDSTGGNSGIAACDSTKVPAGVNYSQSGNVVTVTTNGCVVMSDVSNTNLCTPNRQSAPSGISLLNTNTVSSSSLNGITVPGFPDMVLSLINAAANVKNCTKNAPQEITNLTVNASICLDITNVVAGMVSSLPGVQINAPVQYSTVSTYGNQIVTDCFATDASSVFDAYTGEAWIRQADGTFKQI